MPCYSQIVRINVILIIHGRPTVIELGLAMTAAQMTHDDQPNHGEFTTLAAQVLQVRRLPVVARYDCSNDCTRLP